VADEAIGGLEVHPGAFYRKTDMLVLTRKLMEKLFIGDDICVTVVRLEGGQVRLGIDAPRDVAVVRGELIPHRPSVSRPEERMHAGSGRANVNPPRSEPRGIDNRRRGRFR
jgi:carbon storage regulator